MGAKEIQKSALENDFHDPKVIDLAKKCGVFLGLSTDEISNRISLLQNARLKEFGSEPEELNSDNESMEPIVHQASMDEDDDTEDFDPYSNVVPRGESSRFVSPIHNILNDEYEPPARYDGFGNVGYNPARKSNY